MDFTYDDEQQALREAVRGLLSQGVRRLRECGAGPSPRTPASTRSSGAGWPRWASSACPSPRSDGGVGAGPVEIGIVCRELGRVLAPEPYLTGVVLAGGLVSAAGTAEQRAEVLGAVAAGERVLAVAHDEPDGPRWSTDAPGTTAAQDGDGWRLTGTRTRPARRPRRPGRGHRHPPGGGTGLFLVDFRRTATRPPGPATRRTTAGAPPGSSSTRPRPCRSATRRHRPVRDHRHHARPHPR